MSPKMSEDVTAAIPPGEERLFRMAMDYAGNHSVTGAVLFSDGHVELRQGKDWYLGLGADRPPTRETGTASPPGPR